MRKYTQLCLVIVTVISIIILLMYRSEYKQLQYVLDVVNFMGRKDDIALVRLENETNLYSHASYDFDTPLPVWQQLTSTGFHAYSAFWLKPNHLLAGGELIAIVVGLKHAIVSFKCELKYANNTIQTGKFVFIREEAIYDVSSGMSDAGGGIAMTEDFIIYKFICKVNKHFGVPEQVIFTDINTTAKHYLNVRNLGTKHIKQLQTMTLCVNAVSNNRTDHFFTDFNLLQFFFHHHLIGIDEFLVYDAGYMNPYIKLILLKFGIKINTLPFNFPFDGSQRWKIHKLIELDCLLRTSNSVKYTAIVSPMDYIYLNADLKTTPHFLTNLLKYREFENDLQFEIPYNFVCINKVKKILSDNLVYTSNVNFDRKITLFKTNLIFKQNNNAVMILPTPIKPLERSEAFINHYSECTDRKYVAHQNEEQEWRSLISWEFKQFVDEISIKINALLRGL